MSRDSEKVEDTEIKETTETELKGSGTADEALDSEIAEEFTEQDPLLELEEKLAAAEIQAADYLDGWQRARAEYANAKKRLDRERVETYGRAAVDYAKKMLPILDDFDLALANVPKNVEEDDWFEGLLLVSKKMHAILSDLNVERIEAVGEPFDPNIHEALSLAEAEGFESGTVVEEIQSGYRIGDRIIRPVLVNVAA